MAVQQRGQYHNSHNSQKQDLIPALALLCSSYDGEGKSSFMGRSVVKFSNGFSSHGGTLGPFLVCGSNQNKTIIIIIRENRDIV